MRKMILTGYIVADAEKQVTTNGKEMLVFRMGNSEYNDEKNAEGKPITSWFRVKSWSQPHLNLAKYLVKGKHVIVTGDYKDNTYQNRNNGNYEIGREIILDSIDFCNDNNGNNNQQGQNNYQRPNNGGQPSMPAVTSNGGASKTKQVEMPMTNAVSQADDVDDLPF